MRLTKTATPVPGKVNVWDVKLRIEADDQLKTSDIVLVFDRSGSMEGNKLRLAKSAARSFVENLLDPEGARVNRIGLVSFANNVVTNVPLTNNKNQLIAAINSFYADGGTYTQAALHQADALLVGSGADSKNIVLLSDGEPTFSVRLSNPDDYLIDYPGYGRQTSSSAPESAYSYGSTVGDGFDMRYRYYNAPGTSNDKWYNHGNSTIAEGGFVKNRDRIIYTVALEAGDDGNYVLGQTASPGKAFTGSAADLALIFETIAGDIKAGVDNASVVDPMAMGFAVTAGEISEVEVTTGTATVSPDKKKIDWEIGKLTDPVTGSPDTKYPEMTYRVDINDDILNVLPEPEDGLYETNGDTVLNYTDGSGEEKSMAFPKPKVDPILLIVEKRLLNSLGEVITPDERVFDIQITSIEGYDKTYRLKSGQRKIMTNLRLEDHYSVSETAVSGLPDSELSDYHRTVNVYGVDQSEFMIEQGNPDSPVIVTNQEKELGKITIVKVFKNTPKETSSITELTGVRNGDEPLEFNFKLTPINPAGEAKQFTLKAGEEKVYDKLPYGVYKVEEIVPPDASYAPSYEPLGGEVTISFADREKTVTVTNQYTGKFDVTANKVWEGLNSSELKPDVWFKLHRKVKEESPVYVDGSAFLKIPSVAPFEVKWENLPEYDCVKLLWVSPMIFL